MVRGAISVVNPEIPVELRASTGYTIDSEGQRLPAFADPVTIMCQVQALTFRDIQMLDGLNLQGERRAVYCEGRISGLVRQDNKGGDLLTFPDGTVWLVAMVLEAWPDWVKVAVTQQMP